VPDATLVPPPVSLRLNDAPRYEEFYGFVHSPFTPTADSRFFFRSRSHAAALDLVRHAIRERRPFALLTGDTGTGKTTICRALEDQAEGATITSCILAPVRSAEDLLRTVLVDVGVISPAGADSGRVAGASREELTDTLREFLRSVRPLGATCVLILDEVQQLSPDLLEQIGTLPAAGPGEPPLLTVVLAGEPSLLAALARAELRPLDERIVTRAALEPLTREDTGAYIAHRLSAAGGTDLPTFEPAAVEAVHAHTGGVPRAVNALCGRTLMLASQLGVRTVGAEVVEEAARGAGQPATPAAAGAWWTRVPLWVWIVGLLLVLLAVMAVLFSGAA
jgi:general secretion pathway protein A